jgi:elongation factor Ts
MSVDMKLVKQLREQTGIGIMECKKAIAETNNDLEKAVEYLRKRGYEKAKKKSSRTTNEGIIFSYIHSNSKIGVLLELGCETDFVAANEDFKALAKDISMQIAAMDPKFLSEEEVSKEELQKEKEIYRELMIKQGKPENIVDKIVDGKMKKYFTENCLLNHKFFKDEDLTITQLIAEKIHKLGENITVKRFTRYQVGEEV